MRLELTGRHVAITPALRKLVEKRLAPTLRMLNDNVVSMQIVLTLEKSRHRAEVMLHARGDHILHGNGIGPDAGAALAVAVDKVERQAGKLKGKWQARKRRPAPTLAGAGDAPAAEPPDVRIIRARRHVVKPMPIDDAALLVGTTPDAFLVFRNITDDTIMVLFRRPDGNLGLIEPET